MSTTNPEFQAISATTQDYFEGMYHRNVDRLRQAFHPKACLFGHYKGTFLRISLDQWLEMVEDGPSPADSGEAFDMHIVSSDIDGTAASVKVIDVVHGVRYTDYLTMIKIDGQWKIVNKAYRHD